MLITGTESSCVVGITGHKEKQPCFLKIGPIMEHTFKKMRGERVTAILCQLKKNQNARNAFLSTLIDVVGF